jgi:hypothetical protein
MTAMKEWWANPVYVILQKVSGINQLPDNVGNQANTSAH